MGRTTQSCASMDDEILMIMNVRGNKNYIGLLIILRGDMDFRTMNFFGKLIVYKEKGRKEL